MILSATRQIKKERMREENAAQVIQRMQWRALLAEQTARPSIVDLPDHSLRQVKTDLLLICSPTTLYIVAQCSAITWYVSTASQT